MEDVQIQSYRDFVDIRLLPDLKHTLKSQQQLEMEIKEYETLMEELDIICSKASMGEQILLKVEPKVYRQVTIENANNRIFVNVGKETFVEMSYLEAIRFCHEKVYHLRRSMDILNDRECDIKAHLDMIMFNLEELRQSVTPNDRLIQ